MRKYLYFLLFVSLPVVSCVDITKSGKDTSNQTSEIENDAMEIGLWELSDMLDEFGDPTGEKCLRLTGNGTYNSKLENDEKLVAILFVLKDNTIKIRLLKKGSQIVDDFSGNIRIKDGDGDVHEISFTNDNLGQIHPFWDEKSDLHGEGKKEFRDIIQKEGVMSAIAEESGFLNFNKTTYHFKFNLNGFKKAMRYLRQKYGDDSYQDDVSKPENEEFNSNDEYVSEEELEAVKEKIDFKIESEPGNEQLIPDNKTVKNTDEIVSSFDTSPYFEEGDIVGWLSKHMRYPEEAREMGIQGRVFVSFVIEKDGSTSNVKIEKSVSRELDSEAIRLVKLMKWRPAKLNNENVRSSYNLVIPFRL